MQDWTGRLVGLVQGMGSASITVCGCDGAIDCPGHSIILNVDSQHHGVCLANEDEKR